MISPDSNPALAAGDPGAIDEIAISPLIVSCGRINNIEKIITGRIRFTKDPATRTMDHLIPDCLAKLLGSVGSSSHSILTNTPKGIKLMEYSV